MRSKTPESDKRSCDVPQNLEKVFKHRDLKEKLLETKLAQASMILKEAEERHRLEKERVRRLHAHTGHGPAPDDLGTDSPVQSSGDSA
jgi:hypothetical protein